jgi:peptidyl-prolyl cis-trans isomerase D
MFESIRKHQRILQFVLLLLIFPAFALFGVSGYQKFLSDTDEVASVKGEAISRQEFDQAQRRQLEKLKEMLGDQVDPKMLDSDMARKEVLEGLVAQRALLADASAKKVSVPDARLRGAIIAIPGLTKADGTFDRDQYKSLLGAQGINEATFESQMRRDLALQAIPEAVAQTGFLPKTVADRLLALQEESREVHERLFKVEEFEPQVKTTPEQLKKYYEDNGRQFEIAENAKIEYVILNLDALATQITIDPAKIKEFFEQNRARYVNAEQRKASHILLTVPKDANEKTRAQIRGKIDGLLVQARSGGNFAELAKANSQDPGSTSEGGDLGFFTSEMMAKPFSDAAYGLKPDQISDVVETQFGFHIIKLTGIKPKVERGFDEVKSEIEAEYRRLEAGKEYAKAAETFTNTVYEQADSFKPIVEKLKLRVETAESITRGGAGAAANNPALNNPKLLGALFSAESLKNKRNTDAVDVAPNTLVSARLLEYRPAQLKEFAKVETEVRSGFVKAEAKKLALLAGETALKELKSGAAANSFGEAKKVPRAGSTNVAPNAVEGIFRAPTEKLPAYIGVDLGSAGYGLYQIIKVVAADEKSLADKRAASRQQFNQLQSQQDLNDYLDSVKARSDIKRNLSKLRVASETQ